MADITRRIDAIVAGELARALKREGFRKAGRTFRRTVNDGAAIHVVQAQASKWNAGDAGQFTLNLGVYLPPAVPLLDWPPSDAPAESDCMLRRRLGKLMPEAQDLWWDVGPDTDADAVGAAVAQAYARYGAPWLAGITDLSSARRAFEEGHEYYPAAVLSLALGDRAAAARLVQQALARAPQAETIRWWADKHALLPAAAD